MSQAMKIGAYDEELVITPGPGYLPGQLVFAPSGRAGVVQGQRPLESGEPATLKTTGKYSVVAATAAITVGADVYWDADGNPVGGTAGSGAATATSTDNVKIGKASKAKGSGGATVEVLLNV